MLAMVKVMVQAKVSAESCKGREGEDPKLNTRKISDRLDQKLLICS